jgi:hypothetical protein
MERGSTVEVPSGRKTSGVKEDEMGWGAHQQEEPWDLEISKGRRLPIIGRSGQHPCVSAPEVCTVLYRTVLLNSQPPRCTGRQHSPHLVVGWSTKVHSVRSTNTLIALLYTVNRFIIMQG